MSVQCVEKRDPSPAVGPANKRLRPQLAFRLSEETLSQKVLRRDLTIVGRGQPSALRVRHPEVSNCHAALFWDRERLWFVDLLSANRTRHLGRASRNGYLSEGESILLADIELAFLGLVDQKVQPEPAEGRHLGSLRDDRQSQNEEHKPAVEGERAEVEQVRPAVQPVVQEADHPWTVERDRLRQRLATGTQRVAALVAELRAERNRSRARAERLAFLEAELGAERVASLEEDL